MFSTGTRIVRRGSREVWYVSKVDFLNGSITYELRHIDNPYFIRMVYKVDCENNYRTLRTIDKILLFFGVPVC